MAVKLAQIVDLAQLFISYPWGALKLMRPGNVRCLLSAMARYDRETVTEVARHNLRREAELSREKRKQFIGLARLCVKHPWVTLKKLNSADVRRLLSAMARHNSATVLEIARQKIQREVQLDRANNTIGPDDQAQRKVIQLEACYPGITEPVSLASVSLLEEKLEAPDYNIDPDAPVRVNVLLPQLDPLIMFGGYISCLHFIRHVQLIGYRVRILLCESHNFNRPAVEAKLSANPLLKQAVSNCEVVNITRQHDALVISPKDSFICYSFWTAIKAHHLAKAVGKEFIFYLQEYEAIFHQHDSCYALAGHVYKLPHRAIFNTTLLADYFRSNRLGVYAQYHGEELNQHYVCFQHALTPTKLATLQDFQKRTSKRLLFYGRPESHARRNLFEIAVIGLKQAIRNGVFSDDWEFYGVGTLGSEYDLDLGSGRVLKLRGTLPQSDYGAALASYDIGLSLMMAPHPSILPFEMASAGMIVVTNSYASRTADVLKSISSNIEPCEPVPESVATSLSIAVGRVGRYQERIDGANIDWVRDWDQSFNDSVMKQISEMLRK